MTFKNQSFSTVLLSCFILFSSLELSKAYNPPFFTTQTSSLSLVLGGYWQLLQSSIGVSAMHAQVLPNNKVIIFDRTDAGPSNLSLPAGSFCPKNDCTAHSLVYDIASNTFRPLHVITDTWCSSGSVDPNGTLIQTGGYDDGDHMIRIFPPRDGPACDWFELTTTHLVDRRWYATNQVLPDGRIIIVGGRRVFTYEFYPKNDFVNNNKSFYLRFLVETRDPEENNLYPFLHLLPDGNLFIFANQKSILFDYQRGVVLKRFPPIPGDDKRNYPSTGSSVMLPPRLSPSMGPPMVEVLVCGGAPAGAFLKSDKMKVFVEASRACGRLRVNDPNPQWLMEFMPMPRVMPDMILLPTGDVLIINGATNGTAGWEDAVNPVLNPILYLVNEDPARRFTVLARRKSPGCTTLRRCFCQMAEY